MNLDLIYVHVVLCISVIVIGSQGILIQRGREREGGEREGERGGRERSRGKGGRERRGARFVGIRRILIIPHYSWKLIVHVSHLSPLMCAPVCGNLWVGECLLVACYVTL